MDNQPSVTPGDMLKSVYDTNNDGKIDPAALGTGTPSALTYLNGLGAWTPLYAVVTVTGAYPVLISDSVILGNATTAAFSVLLPTAIGVIGKTYTLKKLDASANSLTLTTSLSQTIDGGATAVLSTQYLSLTVISDGANWQVI